MIISFYTRKVTRKLLPIPPGNDAQTKQKQHKHRRSEKRPPICSLWGRRDQWPVGLFFFNALAFESHQFIKMPCCISKMSPVAEENSLFEKSCFSNFLNWKVAVNIWKHRAFARCFLCCIFHQHILVRDGRFELPTSGTMLSSDDHLFGRTD